MFRYYWASHASGGAIRETLLFSKTNASRKSNIGVCPSDLWINRFFLLRGHSLIRDTDAVPCNPESSLLSKKQMHWEWSYNKSSTDSSAPDLLFPPIRHCRPTVHYAVLRGRNCYGPGVSSVEQTPVVRHQQPPSMQERSLNNIAQALHITSPASKTQNISTTNIDSTSLKRGIDFPISVIPIR